MASAHKPYPPEYQQQQPSSYGAPPFIPTNPLVPNVMPKMVANAPTAPPGIFLFYCYYNFLKEYFSFCKKLITIFNKFN